MRVQVLSLPGKSEQAQAQDQSRRLNLIMERKYAYVIPLGLVIGAIFGVSYGMAFGNTLLGVAFGALGGVFLGWFIAAILQNRDQTMP